MIHKGNLDKTFVNEFLEYRRKTCFRAHINHSMSNINFTWPHVWSNKDIRSNPRWRKGHALVREEIFQDLYAWYTKEIDQPMLRNRAQYAQTCEIIFTILKKCPKEDPYGVNISHDHPILWNIKPCYQLWRI